MNNPENIQVSFTKEEKTRLDFMTWQVEKGRYEEDMKSDPYKPKGVRKIWYGLESKINASKKIWIPLAGNGSVDLLAVSTRHYEWIAGITATTIMAYLTLKAAQNPVTH